MSDATQGSATSPAGGDAAAAAAAAGTPGAAAGADGGQNGSPANGAENPFDGLDTGTRDWVETKGYKTVADLATAARNAESLIGGSVRLPGKDAKPEDWDAFNATLQDKLPEDRRAPESADGYEFKLPEGTPSDMPYSDDLASDFKKFAKARGMSKADASAMHDFYVGRMTETFKTQGQALVDDAVKATSALESAWGGARGSDEFERNAEYALKGIKGAGGDELLQALKDKGLMAENDAGHPIVLSAPIAKAFAKIGAIYDDDGFVSGDGGGGVGDNPFKGGPTGGGNATTQNQIWNADPVRAERLMRAAGYTPKDFGFIR